MCSPSDYVRHEQPACIARDDAGMATWREVTVAAPALADKVRERFEAHGLGFIATLRRDGGPRVSGVEMFFGAGELWVGMMPDSVKAKDLLRDPRFAMHSASSDKDVADGDAKLSGLALAIGDEATWSTYMDATGSESQPGGLQPVPCGRQGDLASHPRQRGTIWTSNGGASEAATDNSTVI